MNRFCFFILSTFLAFTASSQVINNLVVFCNDGEQFTLIMNGARQNETPQTRVKVEGLNLKKYEVKIIYVNKKMKETNTVLTFFSTGTECEFALNKYGARKHKMEYFTEKRIEGFDNPSNSQTNTGTNNTGLNTGDGNTVVNPNNLTTNNTITTNNTNTSVNGCINSITNEEFTALQNSISNQSTDANKQSTANSLVLNKCLSTLQVKDLMKLFSSEKSRADFVKSVYGNIKDVNNYSQLLEHFLNTELQDELTKFFKNKK